MSPLFSRINFVCFVFEQYESVKIKLALSKAACFPISVNSHLAFELTLLGNQNGPLQKTNTSAWRLKRGTSANINDICMGIHEPSRVHCLACIFFFGNLYPSGKYTSKKTCQTSVHKNSPFDGLFDAK